MKRMPPLSEDQSYRGRRAMIAYRGYFLYHGRAGNISFAGHKWTVYSPEGEPLNACRDFKTAKKAVDEYVN